MTPAVEDVPLESLRESRPPVSIVLDRLLSADRRRIPARSAFGAVTNR